MKYIVGVRCNASSSPVTTKIQKMVTIPTSSTLLRPRQTIWTPFRRYYPYNYPALTPSPSRTHILCATTSSTSLSSSTGPSIPDSKEQALQQAASALEERLSSTFSSLKKKGKSSLAKLGFSSSSNKLLLSLEIPVLDDSLSSTVQLAKEIIAALPAQMRKASGVLESATSTVPDCSVLFVPASLQGAAIDVSGAAAVVYVNPPPPSSGNDNSPDIETVYCFMPVAIKASLITVKQGAVFKPSPASQFRVYMDEGKKEGWKQVGMMKERPMNSDIEVVFYNATAANSPLTKAAKALKDVLKR